ncbi:MAG: glycoside hydrolase [Candidatus Nitrosocosmicus sp.]|nr:glycoside hydrolase [Candidatus Nitrosocosmicus sp.]
MSFLFLSFSATDQSFVIQAQPTRNLSNFTSIEVAGNGSHSADLIVDPKTNQIYVTYVKTQNDTSNLYFTKSVGNETFDTFTDPVRVNDKIGEVYWDGRVPPEIEVTDNGTIYTLWVTSKETPEFPYHGFRTLKMAKSFDGGETFTPAVTVANKNDIPHANAFDSFEIGDDGRIYVGYLSWDAKILNNGTILSTDEKDGAQTGFSVSVDGANSFKPIKILDTHVCPCCHVNVLAGSDGDVYTSWRAIFPVAPNTDPEAMPVVRDIVVSHSSDNGLTFGPPVKVANDSFVFGGCVHVGAPMVMDSKGNIHIAWYTGAEDHPGIYYAFSTDKAKSFSKPIPVLTGEWIPPLRSDLAVDDKDDIWITWEDSSGLTALDEKWMFENTTANIFVGKIAENNNNTLTKYLPPVNTENAKLPKIATGNNMIAVLWNGEDSVDLSILRPNEMSSGTKN